MVQNGKKGANITWKNHIKNFFKVGTKSAIWLQSDQNLTHRKTKNPRSKKFRYIRFMETFKIDLHPPGTPKPSKNAVLLQHNWFLESFGVPGECESILNVKCLHKSYITELFGPRVFCFSVGQIFFFLPSFWPFLPRP